MAMKFPYADHLTNEEVDYELVLRNRREDKSSDLASKLRLLRRLFKEDQQEGRRYRAPYTFEQEVDLVRNRVNQLIQSLQEKPDERLVSRLKHYFLRVHRWETTTTQGTAERKELLECIVDNITKASKSLQAAEPRNSEESEEEAAGGQEKQDTDVSTVGRGTIPKIPKSSPIKKHGKPSVEDLLQRIAELEARCERSERKQKQQKWREPEGYREPRKSESRLPERKQESRKPEPRFPEKNQEPVEHDRNKSNKQRRPIGRHHLLTDDSSNDSGEEERNRGRGRQNRRNRPERRESNSRDSVSTDWYGDQGNRGARHYRRIEHWKLSFSGDSKSISVENFLYKLKKIADREGVSDRNLLKDIHLILEGQASDWFFTYVDEFEDWEDFEDRIRYRFGNPNQDQGIRLKIQERKQQRGETFSAFVSEIERLNKMLSKPLSSRRKFEVVWDNMRHHYRSRIATINVRNLDHLTRLNHSIDAVDPSLQFSSEIRNHRNVHHVDCELSDDGSEEVDAIEARMGKRNSRPSYRGPTEDNPQRSVQAQQNVCWNCRKQGHNWRDCKEAKAIFCYGCGNLGQTIRSCSKCAGSRRQRGDENQGNQ